MANRKANLSEADTQAAAELVKDPTITIGELASILEVHRETLRRRLVAVLGEEELAAFLRRKQGNFLPGITAHRFRDKATRYASAYQEWVDEGRPTLEEFGRKRGYTRERARQILSMSENYKADQEMMRAERYSDSFSQAPELWIFYQKNPTRLKEEIQRRGLNERTVRTTFHRLHRTEYLSLRKRERPAVIRNKARAQIEGDPNLKAAWELYQANEKMTFKDIEKLINLSGMGFYQLLERAYGKKFRKLTAERFARGQRKWMAKQHATGRGPKPDHEPEKLS